MLTSEMRIEMSLKKLSSKSHLFDKLIKTNAVAHKKHIEKF